MNVWAVTYRMNDELKTLVIESTYSDINDIRNDLHPAIYNKVVSIEFVGALA